MAKKNKEQINILEINVIVMKLDVEGILKEPDTKYKNIPLKYTEILTFNTTLPLPKKPIINLVILLFEKILGKL